MSEPPKKRGRAPDGPFAESLEHAMAKPEELACEGKIVDFHLLSLKRQFAV